MTDNTFPLKRSLAPDLEGDGHFGHLITSVCSLIGRGLQPSCHPLALFITVGATCITRHKKKELVLACTLYTL